MSIQSTQKTPRTAKKDAVTSVDNQPVINTTPEPTTAPPLPDDLDITTAKIDKDKRLAKDARRGVKPKHRKMAVKQADKRLQGNQWQATPQQTAFMQAWLSPKSTTFGNAYKSAIQAGYSQRYAQLISTPSVANKWLSEYKNKLNLTDEHIKQGISELAIRADDSRSPDDTRLKAYETLARIHNMLDNRGAITVVNVQPILGGKSAPDIIDVDSE